MTAGPPGEEIHNELLRAERSLQAAQLLLKEHLLEEALSRRTAPPAQGVNVASHRTARRLFGQHLIKSGKLAPRLAEILAEEQDDRMLADYDVLFSPERDRVLTRVADAKAFLSAIKVFLGDQGLSF